MRFTLSSSALYSRFAAASKVMASKNSMPILDCFLVQIQGGQLRVTASDGEKYFITSTPLIEASEEVTFCLPSRTIMDSIKEIAEQPITFDFNSDTLEIHGRHNSGSFSVMAQSAEAYPMPRTTDESATSITLPAEVMLNGINRTIFATANEEIRLVMNGIYFDIKPDSITFAGTDGRKLVRNTVTSVQSGMEGGFILPKKVAAIVKNVLSRESGDVVIRFDHEKASIHTEDFDMHFRLIEGHYPNYNAVIPTNNPYQAHIDRASLASALKRIDVFCNQSSNLVKVHLENNALQLTGQDNEYATSAEENLMCDYNNAPISIGFSCRFLLEIANIMESESITMELADPSRPGILRPTEENPEDQVLMLLMPMMLND